MARARTNCTPDSTSAASGAPSSGFSGAARTTVQPGDTPLPPGTPGGGEAAPPTPRPGLRERKKIQTRRAIRRSAYRLFATQGYDATPVDQIADLAEVSPSTVFRYFPTKEDIVLTDEYDPLMAEALLRRPAEERPITAVRNAVMEVVRDAYAHESEEMIQRLRLICEIPAVRARLVECVVTTTHEVGRALAQRTSRSEQDPELQVFLGAVVGGLMQTVLQWEQLEQGHQAEREQPDGQEEAEPLALLEMAFGVLEGGLAL